ncbi:MAG: hypothetical protein KDC45_03240 [Bacteroidetes bacterium]|nr:hypothetical protein [Bacteroidota bacterium]
MIHKLVLTPGSRLFDRLQKSWENIKTHKILGILLVGGFLGALITIELSRLGLLTDSLADRIGGNHFTAVPFAFTLLLIVEIISLVFVIAQSVANSLGKQLELFSLILLRKAFIEFGTFGEPITWERASESIYPIAADLGGALIMFVLVAVYFRIQKHRRITQGDEEQTSFVASKKVVALLLLACFAILGLVDFITEVWPGQSSQFFQSFFTLLIFSDILLVLIALRYSTSYPVVFRNSGFAAATVILRLALTAPHFVNALLGVGTAFLCVGLALAYNLFTPETHPAE